MKKRVKKTIKKSVNVCNCCGNTKWWGIFLIIIGVAWFLDAWKWIIPSILIIWGVSVLMRK